MRRFAVMLVLLAACQDDITTVFPDGLEPLEDNTAPVAQAGAGVEELLTNTAESDPKIVHGRGLVFAPPGVVWAATKDPEHLASCATTRHSAMVGVEPQYEYGWKYHYEVDEIITVAWDELWRFGTITGTPEAPELAIIRYQKVFGSDFISLIEGSIMLKAAPEGHTELEFIEHLSAVRGSTGQMRDSMIQRYHTLVELSHGRPAPGCP
ncbi:MAG: hypothetical protein IPL61_15070 [Myxococcales bacterium]|nr:hypothetical protein [Myxococcales bacterium]